MKDFLSRLVSQIRNFLGSERNYSCLPETSNDAQPAESIGESKSSCSEFANPVEKDRSLL
jgi:hypothetical protein